MLFYLFFVDINIKVVRFYFCGAFLCFPISLYGKYLLLCYF
ncbi:putative membrane protein [Escherichia coli 5-366-08_S1_C1]|nr:putative membrane protein [Escherichia coli 5-366-08_S1_C1]KEO14184.1 putative membrane protein [Escherichia coli 2-177-06_S3_C3]